MNCPFCNSDIILETVDIGVGSIQSSPAACEDCGASQDSSGQWQLYDDGHGNNHFAIGHHLTFTDDQGRELRGLVTMAQFSYNHFIGLVVYVESENCYYGGVFRDKEQKRWVMKPLILI